MRKSKPRLYADILHVRRSMMNEFLGRKVPSCTSPVLSTGVLGIVLGALHSDVESQLLFSQLPRMNHTLDPWSLSLGHKLQSGFWLTFSLFYNIPGGKEWIQKASNTFHPLKEPSRKQGTTGRARYFLKGWPGITKDKALFSGHVPLKSIIAFHS